MMSKEEWIGFFQAFGRPTLKEWLMLTIEQRRVATDAGIDVLELLIGEHGKAVHKLEYALYLCKDKEALEALQARNVQAAFNYNQSKETLS